MSVDTGTGRVMLLCDDANAGRIWAFALSTQGLITDQVGTAEEALNRWHREAYDLVIIDVHIGTLDGIGAARRIRAEAINPILLLTPRDEETHLLKAYEAGVDECVVKPISPSLLLAKVSVWQRRAWTVPAKALDSLEVGDVRLDPARREVVAAGGPAVRLTSLEFRLLHQLMAHRGQTLGPDILIDRVWGYAGNGEGALLKNLVYRLRRKIEPDPSQPRYIQTVTGEGYIFPF